eukprot:4761009-Lingulodinium_polyedra.AAC.1
MRGHRGGGNWATRGHVGQGGNRYGVTRAQERLENLKIFDGGANLVAELPQPGAHHRLWSTGVNTEGGSL